MKAVVLISWVGEVGNVDQHDSRLGWRPGEPVH